MAAQSGLIEQAHVTALVRNSEFLHTHLEDKVKGLLPGLVDASILTVKGKERVERAQDESESLEILLAYIKRYDVNKFVRFLEVLRDLASKDGDEDARCCLERMVTEVGNASNLSGISPESKERFDDLKTFVSSRESHSTPTCSAQDTERQRIIQKEQDEHSKELYNQSFRPLFESLCNEQVCSSLIDQLVSMSLISEADKETLLSSTWHPKVRATSLLEVLNIEEKPHLLTGLIKAMEEVEELKGLADEMLTQHKANEAGEDVSKKIERQLIMTGVNVVDERVFKLEGRRAQPLLWEEHGFKMFILEDALLPYETCHVSVKAIVSGCFQFPEGTEPVSAVYAISLSRQLRKPARIEMQHCVKLENPEHCKSMSFAVASQDPSSMPYQFHVVPGGIFEENKFFGSVNRHQFSFMTIIWKLLGYDIKCIYSASTFTQKEKMDEQLWILAVSKDLDTMKRYLTSSLKEAEQEIEEVTFEFEKEELTLEILDEATPGWIIEPLITPCTITRRQVESRIQPHNIEHGPIVCKVRIAFEKPNKPPDEVLRNRIQLNGIKPECCFNIHFRPPLLRTDSNESTSRRALLSSISSSSSSFTYSFDLPPSLDSEVPTQRDFYKMVILKIPTKWKNFGIMLEIDIERLEGILQDKKNSEDCFLEVYRIGKMELDQQFTWKRVLDILQYDLKENSLRNKIQDKLQDKLLDSVVEAS